MIHVYTKLCEAVELVRLVRVGLKIIYPEVGITPKSGLPRSRDYPEVGITQCRDYPEVGITPKSGLPRSRDYPEVGMTQKSGLPRSRDCPNVGTAPK